MATNKTNLEKAIEAAQAKRAQWDEERAARETALATIVADIETTEAELEAAPGRKEE